MYQTWFNDNNVCSARYIAGELASLLVRTGKGRLVALSACSVPVAWPRSFGPNRTQPPLLTASSGTLHVMILTLLTMPYLFTRYRTWARELISFTSQPGIRPRLARSAVGLCVHSGFSSLRLFGATGNASDLLHRSIGSNNLDGLRHNTRSIRSGR